MITCDSTANSVSLSDCAVVNLGSTVSAKEPSIHILDASHRPIPGANAIEKEEYTSLQELPFYPTADNDPLFDFGVAELFLDGYISSKHPTDGFISFHSLKLCSSNARQTAKYLELSFGFEPVAYRGLENDSRLVGSHVLKNGNVFFEIVNTLEAVDDTSFLVPSFKADLERMKGTKLNQHLKSDFKLTADALIFDFVNCRVDSLGKKTTRQKIYEKVTTSRSFRRSIEDYNKLILDTINNSEQVYSDIVECCLIQKFLKSHGEGVMDIAFEVEDSEAAFEKAIAAGAGIIRLPRIVSDSNGSVKVATVSVPETDIQHTLIEFIDYSGPYLPNYSTAHPQLALHIEQLNMLPPVSLMCIDHCVENFSWNQMMSQARFYSQIFGFHKFWSVDEADISTENTALRSIVMASSNGKIKMPINEPVKSKMRSQIEEFNDFNGGPGVQHIALKTNDIVSTVYSLMARGVEFNKAPVSFYENLVKRLEADGIELREDMAMLREMGILVDYDATTKFRNSKRCNYILQVFTKPLHDRPTLFIEIIQRYHHNGFGKGTFKGLFESIEEQQKLRGTLVRADE